MRPKATLVLILFLFLFSPLAFAQPFFDSAWRSFQAGTLENGRFTLALTVADLNGDGRPDAVTAQNIFHPGLRVFLNQGTAGSVPAAFPKDGTLYSTPRGAWDVVAADLDGDGDVDLAASDSDANYIGSNVVVLRNAGDGTFGPAQSFSAGAPSTGIAAADLDGDGDVDLVAANYGSFGNGTTVSVLRNNGNATFAPPVSTTVENAPDQVAAGDLDGDGDVDLAVGIGKTGNATRVSLLRNDGTGTFTPNGSFVVASAGSITSTAIVILDPDGDGDLDVLSAGTFDQVASDGRLFLLRNGGTGTFTTQLIAYGLPFRNLAVDLAAADLDGDGRDDALGAQMYEAGIVVFRDNNAGSFQSGQMYASTRNVPGTEGVVGVAAADLDGDGDPDALATGRLVRLLAVHENLGDGTFPELPIQGRGAFHTVLDLGDVDGDGDLDVAASHGGAFTSNVIVYRNNGTGTYTESYRTPLSNYGFAKLRDLDGDGSLDLLFVAGPTISPSDFFTAHGNGNGTFGTIVRHPLDACSLTHPNAYDLDSDGDLDVINSVPSECPGGAAFENTLVVSLNNGNSTFQPPFAVPCGQLPKHAFAGDFDEDGDLDLATASESISGVVFGNGDGTFQQPGITLPSGELSENLIVLDLDSDGHLDLASLRDYSPDGTAGAEGELVILFGNGNGAFTPVAYSGDLTQDHREWLASGDVDGDGDVDVIAGGVQDALAFLNDGSGDLSFSGRYGIGPDAYSVHYGDVTGDAVGDLVALATLDSPPAGFDTGLVVVPGLGSAPPGLTIDVEPVGGPIVLPPGGGTVRYTVTIEGGQPGQQLETWYVLIRPNGRTKTQGPFSITLDSSGRYSATRKQKVQASSPAGTYTLSGNAGDFPTPEVSDAFTFEKSAAVD